MIDKTGGSGLVASDQWPAKEAAMKGVVLDWLAKQGYSVPDGEMYVCGGYADIVAGRYGPRPAPGRKPPLLSTISIELKLHDVAGVIRQASNNRHGTDQAYAAMPIWRTMKMQPATIRKFRAAGVGLLAVSRNVVTEVVQPARGEGMCETLAPVLWPHCRRSYVVQEGGQDSGRWVVAGGRRKKQYGFDFPTNSS